MHRTSIILLCFLLSAALILRLFLSFWSVTYLRENTDVIRYKDWARIAYLYGFTDTYNPQHLTFGTLANNQPPGTLYVLSGAYNLQLQVVKLYAKLSHTKIGSNPWINGPLVSLFLRLPAIFSDLIVGIFIFLFVQKYTSTNKALLASGLFLFNPVTFYNSTIWGQMDSVNNVFFIASLYFFFKKKFIWGIIFCILSFFIKLSLLFILPFVVIIVVKQHYTKIKLFTGIIFASLLSFLLVLPISTNPINWIWQFTTHTISGEMQNSTAFAFNFWWVLFRPYIYSLSQNNLFSFSEVRLAYSPLVTETFFHVPILVWSGLLFLITIIPLGIILIKQNKNQLIDQKVFLLLSLVALTGFLFLPRMHERYMYPVFPLLAIGMMYKKIYTAIYILLSLCNLINLYYVWHPFALSFFSFALLNNQNFEWAISITTFIISMLFYFLLVKDYATAKK